LLCEIAVVAAAVAHFRRQELRSHEPAAMHDGVGASPWKWFGRNRGWRS
jgi:hypothetical protein